MPTVRAIVTDAYLEIGVLGPGETLSPELGAIGLLRFQHQLDSWQAKRLMLAVQTPTAFTLTSGTSTVTLGSSGADVTVARPTWVDHVNYIVPGSSPEIEVALGIMDPDTYAALSIKELQSALPTQCFYQTSVTDEFGYLFFWPQVTQNVDIRVYHPQGVGQPATLNSSVTGPPGYAEAFVYQLALRLCAPTGTAVPETLPMMARQAMATVQAPNTKPSALGVDPATTNSTNSGYNILTDQVQAAR